MSESISQAHREHGLIDDLPSTKRCRCGNADLVHLRSLNRKHCPDCGAWIKWNLTKGQKPLL